MDNRSRIAVVRTGDAFPDDIAARYYVLESHLGSGLLRLDTAWGGSVIDREEYYPFGDSSLRTFTKKRFRYVGKEGRSKNRSGRPVLVNEPACGVGESGLYYYGARYYAAWTCRFISVDPLAADYPFYTPYNYAGNKPINKVDIDGLQEEGNSGIKNNSPKMNSSGEIKSPTQQVEININLLPKVEINPIPEGRLTIGNITIAADDRDYVTQFTDPSNKNYDPEYASKFNDLANDSNEYMFQSFKYTQNNPYKNGKVFEGTNGEIMVRFSKGGDSLTKSAKIGRSEYGSLWEETYHAWDIETGGLDLSNPTAYNEAKAWKFSANAPGTTQNFTITQSGNTFTGPTVMNRIKNAYTSEVANWLFSGMDSQFINSSNGNQNLQILPDYSRVDNSGVYKNITGGLGTIQHRDPSGPSTFERNKYNL